MQLDRKALQRMLTLNDQQLISVIRSLAEHSGLDLSSFPINSNDVNSIRSALSGATDDDIRRVAEQFHAPRKNEK